MSSSTFVPLAAAWRISKHDKTGIDGARVRIRVLTLRSASGCFYIRPESANVLGYGVGGGFTRTERVRYTSAGQPVPRLRLPAPNFQRIWLRFQRPKSTRNHNHTRLVLLTANQPSRQCNLNRQLWKKGPLGRMRFRRWAPMGFYCRGRWGESVFVRVVELYELSLGPHDPANSTHKKAQKVD
jgi:hypothetical protein